MASQGKDQKRPLEQKVVKQLLHRLHGGQLPRAVPGNPHAALVEAGWDVAPDETGTDAETAEIRAAAA